jgi:hypothetical protein
LVDTDTCVSSSLTTVASRSSNGPLNAAQKSQLSR